MNKKYEDSLRKLERWMSVKGLSQEIYEELNGLRELLEKNPEDESALNEVYERFYKELEFGTGGLRGILGAGTNRMNLYTVGRATQGMANYVNRHFGPGGDKADGSGRQPAVAVSYDSRNKSDAFAREAAEILAANGIKVYLYGELMPTPALSFAVRYYGCSGGIMVTASHNPAKYNGYKAYNEEGCQINLDQADEMLAEIEGLDLFEDVKKSDAACERNIEMIPQETIDAYIEAVKRESTGVTGCGGLEVVYTPLNGSGNRPVRRILSEIGIGKVHIVEEQELPDGNFPTCPYPNPEKKEALALGLALCEKLGTADLLLATDPDCDRVGIAVKHEAEYKLLTGNEVGVLLLDFICQARLGRADGTSARPMPEKPVAIKTIVSSKMAEDVAKDYGVEMKNVLTGFKFIGEQIGILEREGEEDRYIFGFEESYGYLSGAFVRDKDAVDASMLICEMAAYYKGQGKTLADRLEELYERFGYYRNDLMDFTFEGAAGMEKMAAIMEGLRSDPPKAIIGKKVAFITDYERDDTGLPASNVLEYILEDGSSVMARPSGTEPKLKFYLSAKGGSREESEAIILALRGELPQYVK